jgi:hypothetical protein
MNLGIEDAYVFAKLMAAGEIEKYGKTRHTVDQRVVNGISRLTEMPRGLTPWSSVARFLLPILGPLIAPKMRKWLIGLDHEI